jgi:hypothetical protein
LRLHFNWLIDGEVTHLVQEGLGHEINNIELYLRGEGRADVLKELDDYARDCATFYSESGSLYQMIGILRGADIFWNPAGKPVLFHRDGEPLEGDSPRILFRPRKG